VNCAVCKRPLFDGATACIVCGAPVSPPGMGRPPVGGGAPPMQMPVTDAYAPTHYGQPQVQAPPNPFAPPQQQQQQQPNPFAPQPQQQPPSNPFAPPPRPVDPRAGSSYGPNVPPPPPMMPYAAHYYAAPVTRPDAPNHMATIGFICGLLGLFPFWIGFLLCITAIVCSGFGLQHAGRLPGQRGRGLAIAGLVLGIVFIVPAGCGL
jgi:hypothetical protein